MPATNQNIKVRFVSNVQKRNKELASSAEGKKGRVVYVPEHLETFKRTYICTHGWPVKSRGSGARPRQRLRHTGCGCSWRTSSCRLFSRMNETSSPCMRTRPGTRESSRSRLLVCVLSLRVTENWCFSIVPTKRTGE